LPTYFQWHRKCVGHDQDENFTKEFLGQAMTILSKVWKQQISIISQDKSYFSISPKKIRQGQNSVLVILTFPLQKDDVVKISVEKNGELFVINNVKKRNPYLLKFWMPESLTEITAIVNILVEKNGNIIGSRPMKCESRLRELEEILRNVNNPIDFMCQVSNSHVFTSKKTFLWLSQKRKERLYRNYISIPKQEQFISIYFLKV
uniref:Uncharacterized protein LOC114347828 n=1 Tax=Diabrotica virgifera virgifera TaxID=50390 RepID=A0A6P7HEX1_DIAVI